MLNPTVGLMKVEAPLVSKNALPGQFVIIRIDECGERIPLTICDTDGDLITIIYQIVGLTTDKLNHLQEGDSILDVVGPLGNPTELDDIQSAIVIGGGVGSAIAYPIAKKLFQMGVHVTTILGFRNIDLVILESEFRAVSHQLIVMTDDGSYGKQGLVTDSLKQLIQEQTYDRVFAIGPLVMMKYVSLATKPYNIKTIVSMNSTMVDGTGMCGGCRVSVDGKIKFACVDGPDFDGHLVDFDVAMKRNAMYKSIEEHKYDENCRLMKRIKDE